MVSGMAQRNGGGQAGGGGRPFAVTPRDVVAIAVPMTLTYITVPLVGLIDTGVIGRLGVAALLGGVTVGAVVFDVVFTTFNFLRSGTTGLAAQALGAGDRQETASVLLRALLLALGLGLALLFLKRPLADISLVLMGVAGEVEAAARVYLEVRLWSAPLMLVDFAIFGWLIGVGRTRAVLLLTTLYAAANILLSILLVIGLGLGVAGVAWSAVLAEIVFAAAGGATVAHALKGQSLPGRARVLDAAGFRRLVALNRDIMIRSFALLFAFAWFTRVGARFGEALLAANAVLMHLFLVAGFFLDGLATAAEQLVGRAVGARWRPAFDAAVGLTFRIGGALAALLAAVFLFAGEPFIDAMTTAPEVREAARVYLPWAVLTPLAGVAAFLLDGVFIGATWSREMRNMMLLSVALFLASVWALTPAFGNHGLWAALLIFLGARGASLRARLGGRARATFGAGA